MILRIVTNGKSFAIQRPRRFRKPLFLTYMDLFKPLNWYPSFTPRAFDTYKEAEAKIREMYGLSVEIEIPWLAALPPTAAPRAHGEKEGGGT